jgi:hypothetical protein
LTVAKEEDDLYATIDSSLELKKTLEYNERKIKIDNPIEKDNIEKKYTIYYYLIEVMKKIHAEQQEKKGIFRERAATGGKKTRRKRRFLRKTRKH